MLDTDKWPWVVQIAFLVGGGLAAGFLAVFGRKAAQNPVVENEDDLNVARVERAQRLAAEAKLAEAEIRADFGKLIEATRQSFRDEMALMRNEFYAQFARFTEKFEEQNDKLDERIRELEKHSR